MSVITTFLRGDQGQDLIEYALLAGLISLVSLFAVVNVGTSVNEVWAGVDAEMDSVPTP